VTAADYSVRVSGLPRDATKEEILEHFNNLYDLSKYDWHQKGYCCGCCFRKKSRRPPALVNAAARLDKEAAVDKSRAVRATTCRAWCQAYSPSSMTATGATQPHGKPPQQHSVPRGPNETRSAGGNEQKFQPSR